MAKSQRREIMEERSLQLRVGVVVVVAAMIGTLLVLYFGGQRSLMLQPQKTIYLWFPQAPGVAAQTPVRKNGVLIGRVTDVMLWDEGGVVLTAKIETKFKIRRSELCRISTASLLGDAVLEFVPSNLPGASTEEIGDDEFIKDGIVAQDPLKVLVGLESKLSGAVASMEVAGNEVTVLARNMNTIVGNNQEVFQRVIQKSELAMDHFRTAMGNLDGLVGDPEFKERLRKALEGLPQLMADSQLMITEARQTLASVQQTTENARGNLENLERFTKPLAERGDKLVERIESSVGNIDVLLDQLATFSESLNNRDGTLGRLIHDPDPYQRLQRTLGNIEDATRRLRPILDDVRVFSDKAASDPSVFGINGAIKNRNKPIGVGSKQSSGLWEDPQR